MIVDFSYANYMQILLTPVRSVLSYHAGVNCSSLLSEATWKVELKWLCKMFLLPCATVKESKAKAMIESCDKL